MSSTSIGRGPASGGNENHDGDPRTKTLGEKVGQEPPAGSDAPEGGGRTNASRDGQVDITARDADDPLYSSPKE